VELDGELRGYFPTTLRDRLEEQIAVHPLRREIIATVVTNDLVNRAGLTFFNEMRTRTGRAAPEVACAYAIVRDVFDLNHIWTEIEALDNKVTPAVQIDMMREIISLIERAAAWLLRSGRLDLGCEIAELATSVHALAASMSELLPAGDASLVGERTQRFREAGVPKALAGRIAALTFLACALDICELAERSARPIDRTARIYYEAGAQFALDNMRDAARRQPASTDWQKLAIQATIDDLFELQTDLTASVLANADSDADPLTAWLKARGSALTPAFAMVNEFRATSTPDLTMLIFAVRQLRQALQ
jgi:glutamate dehydrogenase